MKVTKTSRKVLVASAAVLALALSACSSGSDNAASGECGKVTIAMHGWNSYTASAQVLAEVAKKELGCDVTQTTIEEGGVTYDAMEAGTVDAIVEDWGNGRWKEWVDRGAIEALGGNGNVGRIGMYVAPWMVTKYPDITDSKNLNKYANLFKTSESGGKGAWFEGPPGYTTIGEKMIAANKLNFKVISTGSEAALIDVLVKAEKNKTPAIAYFWEPHTLFVKMPGLKGARVNFPENDWAAPADASGLTDYAGLDLQKLASSKLMKSGSSFAVLFKNFEWTNDDQSSVAADIEAGTDPVAAAQKWIDANPDKVKAWTGK